MNEDWMARDEATGALHGATYWMLRAKHAEKGPPTNEEIAERAKSIYPQRDDDDFRANIYMAGAQWARSRSHVERPEKVERPWMGSTGSGSSTF